MKNFLKDYFYYSRSERNGVLVLAFLSVLLITFPLFFSFFKPKEKIDFSAFQQELAAFEQTVNSPFPDEYSNSSTRTQQDSFINPNTASKEILLQLGLPQKVVYTILNYRKNKGRFYKKEDLLKIYGMKQSDYDNIKDLIFIPETKDRKKATFVKEILPANTEPVYSFFDPNTVAADVLSQMGFPKRTIRNLMNYRSKKGVFRKKEELLKIYGMDEVLYEKVTPYITIENQDDKKNYSDYQQQASKRKEDSTKKSFTSSGDLTVLDINQATEEEWQSLYGIGPFLSERIVKFREKLGGFYSIEQVGETYNLPDSTFLLLKEQLQLSPLLKKIQINSIDASTLKNHPYLSWKKANAIIKYRDNHGSFTSEIDLKKIRVLSPEEWEKIIPYLEF